jgi:hypothetical protein
MTPKGVTPLRVSLRPIIVGYTLELEEGDPATMVELYTVAGSKVPFFHRGRSQVEAAQQLIKAARTLDLEVNRDGAAMTLTPRKKTNTK